MDTKFNLSLAGTERHYVVAQIKPYNGSMVHVQVAGPENNRPYGFSGDFQASAELYNWLNNQVRNVQSLTGSGKSYIAAQFDVEGSSIKLQVPGTQGNRAYGWTQNISSVELRNYLNSVIETEVEDEDEDKDSEPLYPVSATAVAVKDNSEVLEAISELEQTLEIMRQEFANLKAAVA